MDFGYVVLQKKNPLLLIPKSLLYQFLPGQNLGADEVTLCPDDSPPGEDCVKLHQLLSHTKSNTTFKFLPASFKLESDTVINIANVSNISFIASGRAEVTCGKTFGLFFVELVCPSVLK